MANPIIDKAVYKGRRWQKCRAAYFALRMGIDGAMCEICHDAPGVIVHHIDELTVDNCNDPDIVYNFDNFQLACWSCHERTKTKSGVPIRADITFDSNGNVVPTGKRIPGMCGRGCPPSTPPVLLLGRAEMIPPSNTHDAHNPPTHEGGVDGGKATRGYR